MAWWLEGVTFQAFLVGLKLSRSIFLIFLESKNKRKKQGKYRKKLKNRNLDGDILLIFTENRNFADISTEISDILFPE